jgi:hypothetical protein
MTDGVTILSLVDRERWVAEHRQGGLPSQSWSYAWGLSASGIEPQLAIVRAGGARMLLPFFERQWLRWKDIATLFGAAGATIAPAAAAPLTLWREFAASKGWVAGYIQLSDKVELARQSLDGDLVLDRTTFVLDLSKTDLRRTASRKIRRKIDHAMRDGVQLVEDPSVLAEGLKRLYPVKMRSVGALPHYYFSAETLDRWARDGEALILGASIDGCVETVYLFRVTGEHAECHLTGSSETGRGLVPWLLLFGVERLRRKGVRLLQLGGGLRDGDGLYRFKEGFRGTPKIRRSVCQIYDRAVYDALCREAAVSCSGQWFPAYRALRRTADSAAGRTA